MRVCVYAYTHMMLGRWLSDVPGATGVHVCEGARGGARLRAGGRRVRKRCLTHTGGREAFGRQTHRRRPRRMAALVYWAARFCPSRMQNVAIVAAQLACGMIQMWFSCGERRRSPNAKGLVLTFRRRGAKVCAAFILRKTVWPFCDGRAHGRPGHVFLHCAGSRFCEAKSSLFIYTESSARSAVRGIGVTSAWDVCVRAMYIYAAESSLVFSRRVCVDQFGSL